MAKIRLPGVYFEENPRIERGVSLGETGVPAFIGVAGRGPLNEPVVIQSVQQFLRFFGEPVPGSYLYASVWGFFMNGGTRCHVIRVAHVFRHGGAELARRARYELLDRAGYPTMEVLASSEGSWGNSISIQVSYPEVPRVHTFITLDLMPGSHTVMLQSTRGVERGMLLRLTDGQNDRFVTVERVRGNEIFWRETVDCMFKSGSPTYVDSVEFDLTVSERNRRTEKYANLSLGRASARNAARVVAQESELVRVNLLASGDYQQYPEPAGPVVLRGGRDGLEGITPEDIIGYNNGPGARYGLGALESNEEVDLVCLPDLQFCLDRCPAFRSQRDMLGVQMAVIGHCERMGDRFAILDLPRDIPFEQVYDYRSKFETSYGALYFPWLEMDDENGVRRIVPPCGFMAGLYARCDRSDGVFRAPANLPLEGVAGIHGHLNELQLTELNERGVNCIRQMPQRGIRPWGARALTGEPKWRYLMSRRVFCAVKRAIYENTQWVVFEVNGSDLRDRVRGMLTDFLGRLWAAGYFPGKTQDEAFYVICDETNNQAEDGDAGLLSIDIGVALGKPLEYIVMSFEHKMEEQVVGI